jgi:hypothetical protein
MDERSEISRIMASQMPTKLFEGEYLEFFADGRMKVFDGLPKYIGTMSEHKVKLLYEALKGHFDNENTGEKK